MDVEEKRLLRMIEDGFYNLDCLPDINRELMDIRSILYRIYREITATEVEEIELQCSEPIND